MYAHDLCDLLHGGAVSNPPDRNELVLPELSGCGGEPFEVAVSLEGKYFQSLMAEEDVREIEYIIFDLFEVAELELHGWSYVNRRKGWIENREAVWDKYIQYD